MIRFALASFLVAAAVMTASCSENRRPDLIVITADTLRVDHLGAYGSGLPDTPHLDAFARSATVFERSAAPMPLTRPSHFSMLTSLYPREHGVVNNAISLSDEPRNVVNILAQNGYVTGGFVGVSLLGPDSGAERGFEVFDSPIGAQERRAESVVQRALKWIGSLEAEQEYFLWVHLFDPHLPYDPPAEFRRSSTTGMSWNRLKQVAADNHGDIPVAEFEEAKALYRDEVAYMDHWVGQLLAGVRRIRNLDDTLVIFTADHGECFENGVFFEHADCLFEPALRIPMIVRHPPTFTAGRRIAEQTSIVDVAPTLLRSVGLPAPESFSGLALQDAETVDDRHVLVQHPLFQNRAAKNRPRLRRAIRSVAGQPSTDVLIQEEKVGLVSTSWKYLRCGGREELYRLESEADESSNLIMQRAKIASEMQRLLEWQLDQHPLNLNDPEEINDELRETLRALGYL